MLVAARTLHVLRSSTLELFGLWESVECTVSVSSSLYASVDSEPIALVMSLYSKVPDQESVAGSFFMVDGGSRCRSYNPCEIRFQM